MSVKVAIVEGKRPTLMPEGPEIERRVLGSGIEIKCYGLLKPDEYETALADLDAVITRPGTPFSKDMIEMMKNAKVIVSLGVGYEHICLETAEKMKIPVCNVPDYGTEEVADTALAMISAHHRKINLFHDHCSRSGDLNWDWRIHRPITRTKQTQLGIIGLGRIGTAVAMRLKGFGYNITFYDPYLTRGFEKAVGFERSWNLEDLLATSNIVSVHTPLTKETAGMIDESFFELTRPDVILINTARGGIFKSADILYHCLKAKPKLRIGSDVWPDEPPKDHPLLAAWRNKEAWLGDRLILCPHSAFYSESAMKDIRTFAAEIVKAVLKGGSPYNVVNGARKDV